ncbi:aminodeoxychorismate synthase component I [Actinoplanes sp. NPDC051513]|uniref:aminodeoxychorismate synthase component I n=1 Tax=Actinoplanes sp. NPDC051513 TaxID=3363908 RepID=UPI00379D6FA4
MNARFDDLVSGRAVACPPPYRVLVASHPDEVAPVLAEVEASGSWAYGFVSYEAAPGLDSRLPAYPRGAGEPPLAWFGLCEEPVPVPVIAPSRPAKVRWALDWSEEEHRRAVEAVRKHIEAGETYQCNLTGRLRAAFGGDPLELYANLAAVQGGAFNAYAEMGPFVVASASPELFFEWAGDRVRTRPMKGTAARAPENDEQVARQLRASPKEQAENLMIVDLLRNDLAKIAVTGSVEVTELFALERYPTVWQLTSEVVAGLKEGSGLVDIFRALFPCGSVTGAPKQRSMEIIRDLECGPRGVYCGAVGLIGPREAPVRARFNVAIRTAVIDRRTSTAVYGAGGGITWGSDPAAEWAELLIKASIAGSL